MKPEPNVVTISQTQYLELLDDQKLLNCLRRAGVDNWDGYDYALEFYEEVEDDQDDVEHYNNEDEE